MLIIRLFLDGPLVLRDINFEIKSGERVGVGEHRQTVTKKE